MKPQAPLLRAVTALSCVINTSSRCAQQAQSNSWCAAYIRCMRQVHSTDWLPELEQQDRSPAVVLVLPHTYRPRGDAAAAACSSWLLPRPGSPTTSTWMSPLRAGRKAGSQAGSRTHAAGCGKCCGCFCSTMQVAAGKGNLLPAVSLEKLWAPASHTAMLQSILHPQASPPPPPFSTQACR